MQLKESASWQKGEDSESADNEIMCTLPPRLSQLHNVEKSVCKETLLGLAECHTQARSICYVGTVHCCWHSSSILPSKSRLDLSTASPSTVSTILSAHHQIHLHQHLVTLHSWCPSVLLVSACSVHLAVCEAFLQPDNKAKSQQFFGQF